MTKRHIKLVLVLVNLLQFLKLTLNRDICKPRKRQHWYPEFGHTKGQIKKIHAKNYISIQGGAGRGGGWNSENHQLSWFFEFQPTKNKKTTFPWPTQLIGPHVAYTTLTIRNNYFFPIYLFIFKKEVSLSPILYFKISTIEE